MNVFSRTFKIVALLRPLAPLSLVGAGYLVAVMTDVNGIEDSGIYNDGVSLLLAVGLFGSTYSIDTSAARQNLRLIVTAVTVGVAAKAALVGAALSALTSNPIFLVLGIAMAQIDPLSVAGIMRDARLSTRAKAILATWSSFDNPVTVIFTLYASMFFLELTGDDTSASISRLGGGYTADIALNLVVVCVSYALWRIVRRRGITAQLTALVVVFAIAVSGLAMLGLAVTGLFFRPHLQRAVHRAVSAALTLSLLALGVLLVGGMDIVQGVALGVTTFLAHILVAVVLTRGMDRADRIHLTLAQQNGTTAILLALLLGAIWPESVAIIAPAIVTVNVIHSVVNKVVDRHSRELLS